MSVRMSVWCELEARMASVALVSLTLQGLQTTVELVNMRGCVERLTLLETGKEERARLQAEICVTLAVSVRKG